MLKEFLRMAKIRVLPEILRQSTAPHTSKQPILNPNPNPKPNITENHIEKNPSFISEPDNMHIDCEKSQNFISESDNMHIDCDKNHEMDDFLRFSQDDNKKENSLDHDVKMSQIDSFFLPNQEQNIDKNEFANDLEPIDPDLDLYISNIFKQDQLIKTEENKNQESHLNTILCNTSESTFPNNQDVDLRNNIPNVSYKNENDIYTQYETRIDEMDPQYPLPEEVSNINTFIINNSTRDTRKKKRVIKTHKKRKLNMLLYFIDNCTSVMKQPKKKANEKKGCAKPREYPKKEYFRTKLIRNFKKFLRKRKVSRKYISEEKAQEENIKNAIDELLRYCNDNESVLSEIAPTESGPGTEGKAKSKTKETHKTYNREHVEKLFSKPEVLEAYKKYIHVLFLEKSPNELSKMFDFYCCENNLSEHTYECYSNWKQLRPFCYFELIEKSPPENSEVR
ncbi:hypothetical protein SteCoe_896 [Stentor coeruleus]|uniref:RGS domain-containing protein n=1 Tax=Stentor coeruleus TaxID=5963 RepID=A0A1R2D358_9CILI|nr:hypothetical protein SteCoe_896 [Stentor coeruleus]